MMDNESHLFDDLEHPVTFSIRTSVLKCLQCKQQNTHTSPSFHSDAKIVLQMRTVWLSSSPIKAVSREEGTDQAVSKPSTM